MNIKIRPMTIAVVLAIVLFIIVDIVLLFGFINIFDSLDTSSHYDTKRKDNYITRPPDQRTVMRTRGGSLTIIDDEDIRALRERLLNEMIPVTEAIRSSEENYD